MVSTDSTRTEKATEATTGGAPLYKRAGLRHAEVGRGRRVHYSQGNDDTLCGRALTAYLDIEEVVARFDRGDELCTRCMRAAEGLAYAKSCAAESADSPATRAAAELAEIVAKPGEANRRFRDAMENVTRTNNTTSLSELARWTSSLWPHADQSGAPEEFRLLMTRAAETTHLLTLAGIARRAGHLWDRPEDAVEGRMFLVDAETRAAFADVVPAARPLFGEVLVMVRADEVRPGDTVFGCTVEGASIESATMRDVIEHADPYTADPRPYDPACGCLGCETAKSWTGPVITLATETAWDACDPVPAAAPVLIRAGRRKPAEDAVEAPQTPAGTAPEDAAHPDTVAALAVLAGTQLATVADGHDITGSGDYDDTATGALVEPRGGGRVAVYWLVEGLYVTTGRRKPHRAELRILADRFRAAGWRIEPGPSGCVFVWRPSAEA